LFAGNYETGKLLLRTRNIGRFGTMEFQMAPEPSTMRRWMN